MTAKEGYTYRSPPADPADENTIDVRLSGGVVQDVHGRTGKIVRLFDYDVEGTPEEQLDLDEDGEPCVISTWPA